MTLQEFITKYQGKFVNFDGAYGAQCMDLYRYYVKEVWEKPQTPKVIGAYQVFNSLPVGYDKTNGGIPQPGDVITWSEDYTKYGHIGIVVEANKNNVSVFEQNNPIGANCRIGVHSYKYIIGWFRPGQETMAKKYKVNDHGKLGVLVSEGFTGAIMYAKDQTAYNDLLKDFEVPIDAPTINLP